MAGRALRFEICFARCRVAHHNRRRLHARRIVAGDAEAVDERGDIRDLGTGHRELGHPLVDASVLDHRRDQFPVLVVEDDLGTDQVRPALAAACVASVAELAVHAVERLASLDHRRIAGRTLRIGVRESTASAPSTTSTARRGLGRGQRSHHDWNYKGLDLEHSSIISISSGRFPPGCSVEVGYKKYGQAISEASQAASVAGTKQSPTLRARPENAGADRSGARGQPSRWRARHRTQGCRRRTGFPQRPRHIHRQRRENGRLRCSRRAAPIAVRSNSEALECEIPSSRRFTGFCYRTAAPSAAGIYSCSAG